MLQSITIDKYFENPHQIIDVRSPSEFSKGHIPGAVNIALFSDEERAHIGTTYVKQSRDEAMEIGYNYANPKRQWYIDQVRLTAPDGHVTVHCWRGGMRSQLFAQHLHENGFEDVAVIKNGYKAFRNLVTRTYALPFNLKIIGGYTGSGKTLIIHQLQSLGNQAIDLEALACHKGSAFGAIGQKNQPTSEQFENDLYEIWRHFDYTLPIWLEDESCNIGRVNLPAALFAQMRKSPTYFLNIPREIRAAYLVDDYAVASTDELAASIKKIAKRLGGQNINQTLQWLNDRKLYEVAYMLLSYYDKAYLNGLSYHNKEKVFMVAAKNIDTIKNTESILNEFRQSERK